MLATRRFLVVIGSISLCPLSAAGQSQSPPPWGALLPQPSAATVLQAKAFAIDALIQQGLDPETVDQTCGDTYRYTRDPEPLVEFIPPGAGVSLDCLSFGPNGYATHEVEQLAQAAGYQEAYYYVAYSLADPEVVAAIPISVLDGCCVVQYQLGLNEGLLAGGATGTNPGSVVTLGFANAQSIHSAVFLMVSLAPVAPQPVGFGFLHVHPGKLLAVFPTGLFGGGLLNVSIPNSPSFLGEALYLQAAFLDVTSGAVEPKRLTNGLVVSID